MLRASILCVPRADVTNWSGAALLCGQQYPVKNQLHLRYARTSGPQNVSSCTGFMLDVAQLEPLHFSGLRFGEGVYERNRARILVRRNFRLDVTLQRLGHRRIIEGIFLQHDMGFDDLTTIRVRKPTTAHSSTAGWVSNAFSTSGPAML